MGISRIHLTESERERIARSLFHVSSGPDSKGELRGLCPIHNEKNTSFSYNITTDLYNCFSCGASGDLVRLWSNVRGISDEKEGFKSFCKEFDITLESKGNRCSEANIESLPAGEDEEKEPHADLERVWKMFPPLPCDRIARLEQTRGWNSRQIEELDLRLQTFYKDKKTGQLKPTRSGGIAIPIWDSKGRLANIRIYKPGEKQFKVVSWAAGTGEARLFPAAPINPTQPVLLCEGESDTICALSNGFNAITQTTKPKTWKNRQLEVFRGRDIVVAFDADQPGQKYMGFAAKALDGVARSVRILTWPDYMGRRGDGSWPEDHGEDLTDFFVKHRKKQSDLQELIESAKLYTDEDTRRGPLEFFERGAANDRLSFKPRLLAEKIMRQHRLLYEQSTGLMYRWNGRVWTLYDEDLIAGECLRLLENESDKSRAENALYHVKKLNAVPAGRKLNDRTDWACVSNGLLNLRTLELIPHDPDYLCTFYLPVEYDPQPDKICNRFLQYLDETIQEPEVIAQLQEFSGYCLTHSTQFEKCLLLLGPGADGKSTYLKVLRELVGPENCASVSFNDLDDQFQRSSLYAKLLNISTEVGSKAIESPYFKAITSGDPLNAAFKHKNTFTFTPTCKLAFAANDYPVVRDNSDGFFRRLLPIRFKRQFLDDADTSLLEKLKAELSEIFIWALVGLHRLWDQESFTTSSETRKIIMEYRRRNDPVVCFCEDECIIGADREVSKKEIYNHYRQYCGVNGYQPVSREKFFSRLYLAVANIKQYRPRNIEGREYMIQGIGINADTE